MTRSNKHTHTQSKTKKIVLIAIAAVLVVIAGGYTYRSTYYQDRFLPNTSIDDIDISNKTVAEANDLLHDRSANSLLQSKKAIRIGKPSIWLNLVCKRILQKNWKI